MKTTVSTDGTSFSLRHSASSGHEQQASHCGHKGATDRYQVQEKQNIPKCEASGMSRQEATATLCADSQPSPSVPTAEGNQGEN